MGARITELLGIEHPIFQGAMAWIADASLAKAVSNAGGLGILAGGSANADVMARQIDEAKARTDKPFALVDGFLQMHSDRIAMMENAVHSILTPEGFASILWKDASRAAEAADAMKPTAWQAKAMGIVDEVIREEGAGAHEHPEQAAQAVKEYVVSSLRELEGIPVSELVRMRQERFSRIGVE